MKIIALDHVQLAMPKGRESEARAFYSGQDTRTPVFTAVIDLVVAVGTGVALVGSMGLSGIAMLVSIVTSDAPRTNSRRPRVAAPSGAALS